jgi:hypothetical protein
LPRTSSGSVACIVLALLVAASSCGDDDDDGVARHDLHRADGTGPPFPATRPNVPNW